MQTPPPQTATHNLLRYFWISGRIMCLTIPQDSEMIILQLAGQGGDAEEQLNLPHSSLQKTALQKELLVEGRLCQPDVQCEGNRSSGNDSKISVEHEGGFQLLWKSRADTFLCAGQDGSACAQMVVWLLLSCLCAITKRLALQTCQNPTHFFPKPLPIPSPPS